MGAETRSRRDVKSRRESTAATATRGDERTRQSREQMQDEAATRAAPQAVSSQVLVLGSGTTMEGADEDDGLANSSANHVEGLFLGLCCSSSPTLFELPPCRPATLADCDTRNTSYFVNSITIVRSIFGDPAIAADIHDQVQDPQSYIAYSLQTTKTQSSRRQARAILESKTWHKGENKKKLHGTRPSAFHGTR